MPFSLVPFLLLAIPIAEIAAFVVIGGQIGVFATLAMIVVTAVIGSILLRVQGFSLIARIQAETDAGRVPGRELVHGVMILVAGVLLLTPGFITDTMGFLLFIPALRDLGWRFLKNRITVVPAGGFTARQTWRREDGRTIDLEAGEYHDTDESDPRTRR